MFLRISHIHILELKRFILGLLYIQTFEQFYIHILGLLNLLFKEYLILYFGTITYLILNSYIPIRSETSQRNFINQRKKKPA